MALPPSPVERGPFETGRAPTMGETDPHAPLLLDTHTAIWMSTDAPVAEGAREAMEAAYAAGLPAFISPISAWEIGMLAARGRVSLSLTPQVWFRRLLRVPGISLAEMSPAILIVSSFLPGPAPRDPADRILLATARELGYRLVTRDRVLLAYAAGGHVQAIGC